MANFQGRLKELRKSREWTQAELAKRVGVSEQAISHYENGRRAPDQDTLIAIGDIFNVSSDYLLGKDGVTAYLIGGDDMIYYGEEINAVRDPELRLIIRAYIHADQSTKNAVRRVLGLPDEKKHTSVS